jgi:hypothetical protein
VKVNNKEFSGVLKVAGEIDRNNCVYTKECLEKAVEEYNKNRASPNVGAIFTPELNMTIDISEVAFEITKLEYKESSIVVECRQLDTPKGRVLSNLLEIEKNNPNTITLGMDGVTETLLSDDSINTIENFKIERISVLNSKDKA